MKQETTGETLCPLARAAAIIADRWTILILRELRMGNDRFDGIQAQTGMSPNLLTQRLKSMEDNGLIERRLYQERPARHAYCVTDKTRELDAMMLSLRLWGMRHCGLDPKAEGAVTMKHRRTGVIIGKDWQPQEADLPFSFSHVDTQINASWAAERAARAEAFSTGRRIKVSKRTPPKKDAPAPLKTESGKSTPRKRASASLKE